MKIKIWLVAALSLVTVVSAQAQGSLTSGLGDTRTGDSAWGGLTNGYSVIPPSPYSPMVSNGWSFSGGFGYINSGGAASGFGVGSWSTFTNGQETVVVMGWSTTTNNSAEWSIISSAINQYNSSGTISLGPPMGISITEPTVPTLPPGFTGTVIYDDNGTMVIVDSVPEPTTLALGAVCGWGLWRVGRRRGGGKIRGGLGGGCIQIGQRSGRS